MRPSRIVTLALLLCLVVLIGWQLRPDPAPPGGPVPWTDQRPEAAALAQSPAPPACRMGQLGLPRDEQRWGGVWDGAVVGFLMIQNDGSRPCGLPAPSRVTALMPSGLHVPFDVGSLNAPPVELAPGGRVQVQVSSPYACAKPLQRSAGFGFTFPTGTLHVAGARMAVQCAGALVDFTARDGGTPASTTSAAATSRLVASISEVRGGISPDASGSSVTYTVRLTNPTSTPIALDPCPAYQEGIKGRPATARTYQLNCGPVSTIGAHRSVSFAMRLPLPHPLSRGEAVVDWRLQAPARAVDAGQFAAATVRVR